MTVRPRLSRRSVLAAAGAGAAGLGLGLAACAEDAYDGDGVYVARARRAPDDPDDDAWALAPRIDVALGAQDMAMPMRPTASVPSIRVQALHDGTRVSFRLEWDDAGADDLTIEVDRFRDACAVMFVVGEPDLALRPMGSTTVPATLLHWKADWQRDLDDGRQGLDAAYPNRSVDTYPPLLGVAPADVGVEAYEEAGATEWLPAYHVHNPIARGPASSAVEKLVAYGFGSATPCVTQNAHGRGSRTATGWAVVVGKPLGSTDAGETPVGAGSVASCAFSVWSGADQDGGSKKSPSVAMSRLVFAP